MNYLVSGAAPRRLGNAHPTSSPTSPSRSKDGHVIIAVGNDGQFRGPLRRARPSGSRRRSPLRDQSRPRRASRGARAADRRPARGPSPAPTSSPRSRPPAFPPGPINTVAQVFADPQVVARGMRLDLATGDGGTVPSVRTPILMSDTPPSYDHASPRLGEHTARDPRRARLRLRPTSSGCSRRGSSPSAEARHRDSATLASSSCEEATALTRLPYLFLAVALGAMIAIQPGLNADVARRLGTPVGAAFLSVTRRLRDCRRLYMRPEPPCLPARAPSPPCPGISGSAV